MEKRVLISREDIKERVRELAQMISSDYSGKELVLIGVLNGVVFFFSDLAREIKIPCKIDFIRAASYGSEMKSCGEITMTKDVEIPVEGKHLIVVEDIVDTGLTLNHIVKRLAKKNPKSIRICALIDKLERREEAVKIDYRGFEVEKGFLVGYGLDYNEQYRCLTDICTLS